MPQTSDLIIKCDNCIHSQWDIAFERPPRRLCSTLSFVHFSVSGKGFYLALKKLQKEGNLRVAW
jgi:hypothetical protein